MLARRMPRMVYADEDGNIFDHPYLEMAGSSARVLRQPQFDELIPLPEGSELFLLPGRYPIGFDREHKEFRVVNVDPYDGSKKILAVAAFMAPAHTQLLTAAYKTLPHAPVLPLFSYTAVGWIDGNFYVCGIRVDPSGRQDIRCFDQKRIEANTQKKLKENRKNRLIKHLAKCALVYGCPAAKNYFLQRWEAPLPTSPSCNAGCLGCISLQKGSGFCASQDRIRFVPCPEEIAEVASCHLMKAREPVVSFGQGCEGEPLLQGTTLQRAIRIVRKETQRGTINLNTNGSKPEVVGKLMESGLDSIRVSLNSCRERYFALYSRPRGYSFKDLKESVKVVKKMGGFASINYLLLPGLNDEPEEFDALCGFIEETSVDLIQMRNLNIDPNWYLDKIGHKVSGQPLGILALMSGLKKKFPHLRFGYFNPCLDRDQ